MTRGRVLLLEDDLALRGLLVEALVGEDFDVQAFETIAQVVAAAHEHAGDVVVADYWGDSQRTLEATDREEIQRLGAIVPTVLLTGRSWAADNTALQLGARALIRKPFDLDYLLETVERVLTESAQA